MSNTSNELPNRLETLLAAGASGMDSSLEAIAAEFDAVTATVHRIDDSGDFLILVSSRGLPEKIVAITRKIPVGKGMAGLCAARRAPVSVCNIQEDDSGTARPGAKQTGAGGGIVVPIFTGESDLLGTLGIGKPHEHEYTADETALLERCASVLGSALPSTDESSSDS